jgi:hypothetical protein
MYNVEAPGGMIARGEMRMGGEGQVFEKKSLGLIKGKSSDFDEIACECATTMTA